MAEDATVDFDGDNTIDRWGVYFFNANVFDYFINSNDGAYVRDENGWAKFSLTEPAVIAAILDSMFPYNNPDRKDFSDRYPIASFNKEYWDNYFDNKTKNYREFVHKEFSFSITTLMSTFDINSKGLGSIIKPIFDKFATEEMTEDEIMQLIKDREKTAQNLLDGTINAVKSLE